MSVSVFEMGKRREDPDTKLSYPITQYMQCVPPKVSFSLLLFELSLFLSPSSHLNYHLVIVQASLAYESMTVNSNNQFTKIHPRIVTKD